MIEKVHYAQWQNNYRLSDGRLEAIVTADVGPRVIRFGFAGGPNEFAELFEHRLATPLGEWRIYGGHRLWHSPEAMPRSYCPDNEPVEVECSEDCLEVRQPKEELTGIRKAMRLTLGDGFLDVEHSLTNEGPWAVELAPWALSVMAPGGVAILPQATTTDPDGLLPNRLLVLWPYTDPRDPRLYLGRKLVLLHQDAQAAGPIKVGLNADSGWAAYYNRGHLFLKRFTVEPWATYPDYGCTVESYTNAQMLELETLGPLVLLEPGEATYHTERWYLFEGVELPLADEQALLREVWSLVERTSEPE